MLLFIYVFKSIISKLYFLLNQMFELCKKVQVYNYENHYYYLGRQSFSPEIASKLGLHKLKVQPLESISSSRNAKTIKYLKKGIKLSKTINATTQLSYSNLQYDRSNHQANLRASQRFSSAYHFSRAHRREQNRIATEASLNSQLVYSLYNHKLSYPSSQISRRKSDVGNIQKIKIKQKPVPLNRSRQYFPNIQPVLYKKQTSVTQSMNKNLSETKPPINSKIQTCCTNEAISSNHLISKFQPQNINLSLRQSNQNSQSKLISISKSVSSLEQTIKQKDYNKVQSQNGSHVFQISLSNIFSKQQLSNETENKKSNKCTPMKKLNLFYDSERYTIQSRLSREMENTFDYDNVKVQQSFIEQNDVKQSFKVLEANQIRKKDYVMVQAIQDDLGLIVSLKEFLSTDMKLIAEELQVYQFMHHNLQKSQYSAVLDLYKVELRGSSHILIKQPYSELFHVLLKQSNSESNKKLREEARTVARDLLEQLQQHNIFATRKITTHEFVICFNQLKIHDMSIFKHMSQSILSKQEIIAGIDI